MIRARAGGALILGIDAENVKRLRKNLPIHLHFSEVDNGVPVQEVIIMYGDTLDDIVTELKKQKVLPPNFVRPPVKTAPRH